MRQLMIWLYLVICLLGSGRVWSADPVAAGGLSGGGWGIPLH